MTNIPFSQGDLSIMKIEFCGVRGSIPKPLNAEEILARILLKSKDGSISTSALTKMAKDGSLSYGGNTSCVYLEAGAGKLIIDAGTGIRSLNKRLEQLPLDEPISILLTHLHWDHIQGLPFFSPLYQAGRQINIYSAVAPDSIEAALRQQWQRPFFPVPYEHLQATIRFVGFKKKCSIGHFNIDSIPMIHPDPTFGYKVESQGKTYAHFSDTELLMLKGKLASEYKKFLHGVDFLTTDAQFDIEEAQRHPHWGHSAIASFIDLLKDSQIKTLAMFHYNPQESETKIDEIFKAAKKQLKSSIPDGSTKLICAIEGQIYQL
jgi:phosphoribosyl 1,2-cyclic phosphodiesterase